MYARTTSAKTSGDQASICLSVSVSQSVVGPLSYTDRQHLGWGVIVCMSCSTITSSVTVVIAVRALGALAMTGSIYIYADMYICTHLCPSVCSYTSFVFAQPYASLRGWPKSPSKKRRVWPRRQTWQGFASGSTYWGLVGNTGIDYLYVNFCRDYIPLLPTNHE